MKTQRMSDLHLCLSICRFYQFLYKEAILSYGILCKQSLLAALTPFSAYKHGINCN